MTFTDDDLKQLKACFTQGEGFWKGDKPTWQKLDALLARLEAAEDAVNQAYRCTPYNREYYKVWRKAAGK